MSKFSIEDLTMKEVTVIEQKSGISLSALADEGTPQGPLMTAIYWVAKKRENASFKYEQAENATFKEVSAYIGSLNEEDADPNANG
ncbi:hypothetical protein [Streptomyces sp. NPDC127595]|uniref:hypothetical protein n=1 Tax=Streptomyces sp. NPDC127595 TaxID=3345405 RepID=UPI003625BCAA